MTFSAKRVIGRAKRVLDYALTIEDLETTLACHGFQYERLQEGQRLLKLATALSEQQQDAQQARLAATQALYNARHEANNIYQLHLNVARRAFAGDAEVAQLLQPSPKPFTLWFLQAEGFYRTVQSNALHQIKLEHYGVTSAELEQGWRALVAVDVAKTVQERRRKAAITATCIRNAQAALLRDWLTEFAYIARLAFAEQPETLLALGLLNATQQRADEVDGEEVNVR